MSVIYFTILVFGVLVFLKKRKLLSPVAIIYTLWFLSLFIRSLNLIQLTEISLEAYFLIFNVISSFVIMDIIFKLNYTKRNSQIKNLKKNFYETVSEKKINSVLITIFIIASLANLYQITIFASNYGFTIQAFFNNAREDYGLSIIGTVSYLATLVPVISSVYYYFYKKHLLRNILFSLIAIFFLLLSFQKTNIIVTIIWLIVVLALFMSPKKQIKYIILAIIFVVLIFNIYGLIFSPYYGLDYRFWVRDSIIKLPQFLSFLSQPIIYFIGSFSALSQLIADSRVNLFYGAYTFKPVLQFLSFFINIDYLIPSTHGTFYNIGPMDYNVYTFLRHAYNDFGYVGAIIFPYIIAYFSNLIYYAIIFQKKIYLVFLYGIIAWCLIISTFSSHFSYTYTWMYFVISYIIGMFIRTDRHEE